MRSPTWQRFVDWLCALEARGDAWAATQLGADEYAEAVVLDKQLKRNFWRWLAAVAIAIGVLKLIVMGVWPQLGWARAFSLVAFGFLFVLMSVLSGWYGWRKYAGKPAWKVVLLFNALLLGGAILGFVVANFNMGRPLAHIDAEKAARAIAIAVLLGIVISSILVGISHLRLREAIQKSGRLQAEAERERLARHSVQAELKLLQAQVEPHFLFNTLANLRYLVQSRSAAALPMLDHLIQYLRTAMPEIRSDGSTLGREADHARAYLEIMRLRMGGALEFSIDVPAGLSAIPFPPLMLITLVENAIKHGIAPQGRGRVAVRAIEEGDSLRVQVEDDGRGLSGPVGQGVGLANVRDRLRALHGDAARLELESGERPGTRATIEMPLR